MERRIACGNPTPDVREMRSAVASGISESFVAPSFFGLAVGIATRLRMTDDAGGMTQQRRFDAFHTVRVSESTNRVCHSRGWDWRNDGRWFRH
jgi:hypothetical protein